MASEAAISVALDAPCAPYQPVEVRHGPLVFGDETSIDGALRVTFPAWLGVENVSLSLPDSSVVAAVPENVTASENVLGVVWADGSAKGRLGSDEAGAERQELGFWPENGASYVETIVASGTGQVFLDVPVTEQTCGVTVSAEILSPQGDVLALSLPMPGCEALQQVMRVPLSQW